MSNSRTIVLGLVLAVFTCIAALALLLLARRELSGSGSSEREADLTLSENEQTTGAGSEDSALKAIEPAFVTPGATAADNLTVTPGPAEPEIEEVIYTIQTGDNLYQLSLAYGVPMETIMAANGLVDPRLIYAGQTLIIPVEKAVASPQPELAAGSGATGNLAVGSAPTPIVYPPTSTPLPPPLTTINGLTRERFLIMPPAVRENVAQIYARGQQLGRNPRAFSKVGDSTIENPYFLARFDETAYNLGDYGFLQAVIDYFRGSFGRQGMAVRLGFHSWTVNDPMWAEKSVCLAGESPIACEVRLFNPSFAIIRLGSNDVGVPEGFAANLRQIVAYFIDQGIVPVLGTKADRFEGPDDINNTIIRQVAADYQVPLWDFDLVAGTIPGKGLDVDGVHLTTFYAHDYTSPEALQRGHSVHNLSALLILDALWREVTFLPG